MLESKVGWLDVFIHSSIKTRIETTGGGTLSGAEAGFYT